MPKRLGGEKAMEVIKTIPVRSSIMAITILNVTTPAIRAADVEGDPNQTLGLLKSAGGVKSRPKPRSLQGI